MRYNSAVPAVFLSRPNRFVARVLLGGREETVHVKNTGRLRELLVPGAEVVLCRSDNPGRKTAWDLIAVKRGEQYVNVDSQAPNAAAAELLARLYPGSVLRAEQVFGSSRFDFSLEQDGRIRFIEVKGVTLVRGGTALFPDAPTERGWKHLSELADAVRAGHEAAVLFLVQRRDCVRFSPNRETDPAFADALAAARDAGVEIWCRDCDVAADAMTARAVVPVIL